MGHYVNSVHNYTIRYFKNCVIKIFRTYILHYINTKIIHQHCISEELYNFAYSRTLNVKYKIHNSRAFFLKKCLGVLSVWLKKITIFIVQIWKNKCSHWKKLPRTCNTSYYTAHNNFQIGMRLCSLTSSRFLFLLLVSIARCCPLKNHEFTYTEGLKILTWGPTNFINIKFATVLNCNEALVGVTIKFNREKPRSHSLVEIGMLLIAFKRHMRWWNLLFWKILSETP
jgi:hypothetical protein